MFKITALKINCFVIFSRFIWFVFEIIRHFAIIYSLDDCLIKPGIYVAAVLLVFYKGEKSPVKLISFLMFFRPCIVV